MFPRRCEDGTGFSSYQTVINLEKIFLFIQEIRRLINLLVCPESYNDCPDILGAENCFLALELEHAGEPVESFVFSSAKQVYSMFLQVYSFKYLFIS